jgi:hypothetical protein
MVTEPTGSFKNACADWYHKKHLQTKFLSAWSEWSPKRRRAKTLIPYLASWKRLITERLHIPTFDRSQRKRIYSRIILHLKTLLLVISHATQVLISRTFVNWFVLCGKSKRISIIAGQIRKNYHECIFTLWITKTKGIQRCFRFAKTTGRPRSLFLQQRSLEVRGMISCGLLRWILVLIREVIVSRQRYDVITKGKVFSSWLREMKMAKIKQGHQMLAERAKHCVQIRRASQVISKLRYQIDCRKRSSLLEDEYKRCRSLRHWFYIWLTLVQIAYCSPRRLRGEINLFVP